MSQMPSNFIKSLNGLFLALLCVSGCRSADSKAQHAYADYQIAIAANDLPNARKALLALVSFQDNVSDNWVELGKLQATMGAYGDAQYAFTRAYELNRRDPDILRVLTQLNLRAGDFTAAQGHAKELELLSPSDPWTKLADGYVALSQLRFDEALAISNSLLATSPLDSNGMVLKARALLGQLKFDEALALVTSQIAAVPGDAGALQLAEKIYEQRSDWGRVAQTIQRLNHLVPQNRDNQLLLIKSLFRSGADANARSASLELLRGASDPLLIETLLDIWANYWPSPQRVMDARSLGKVSRQQQRFIFADFLNRMNDPFGAIALVGISASQPVDAQNVQANAVLADALARSGKVVDAAHLFGAVLLYDSGNAIALRGRAELLLRTGRPTDALPDAQKLVSVLPQSARDRLLLARCYEAVGNHAQAENTLWEGFHDITANDSLFEALKALKRGSPDAIASLSEEYTQQRDAQLFRGIL